MAWRVILLVISAFFFSNSVSAQTVSSEGEQLISNLEIDQALAIDLGGYFERDSKNVQLSLADGYWAFSYETNLSSAKHQVSHRSVDHANRTCVKDGDAIKCVIPVFWRESGCCAVAEEQEFKTAVATYIFKRSDNGELRLKQTCHLIGGKEQCSWSSTASAELAASIRQVMKVPNELSREPIPQADHLNIDSFEPVYGASGISGLKIVNSDAGPAFSGQGLKEEDVIVRLIRLAPLEPFITQGGEDMLRVLATLPEGGRVAIDVVGNENGPIQKLTLTHRSQADILVIEQIAKARRHGIFPRSVSGIRMQLVLDGSFEALRSQLDDDMANVWSELGPMGPLMKLFVKDAATAHAHEVPYAGMFVAYAIARFELLGSCGEPVSQMTETTVMWTEYRNGLGQYRGSSAQDTITENFSVPRKFRFILDANRSRDVGLTLARDMVDIVNLLDCSSNTRKLLEDNIVAFFRALSPAHVAE